jgi:hypothetical protein
MGFWVPALMLGFQSPVLHGSDHDIIYFEALTVLSALIYIIDNVDMHSKRLAILTDSFDTVEMFNSLRAKLPMNGILLIAASAMVQSRVKC